MRWPPALVTWTAVLTGLMLGWLGLAVAVIWADLEPADQGALRTLLEPRVAQLLLLAFLMPLGVAGVIRWWMRAYPRAALRMRDEVRIIVATHPQHRVSAVGAPEMRALAEAVNALAQAHVALHAQIDDRIQEAKARLAQERTRLAALMSELTHGVLVCNREGRILLYNAHASALLEGDQSADGTATGALVGLNRSVFGVLDRGPIVHALEQLMRRIEQAKPRPVARFVTTRREVGLPGAGVPAAARTGQLLRAQMVPVQGADEALSGFVLILDDITREVDSQSRRDLLLQQLTEGTRGALANLRAAAETLDDHPGMDETMRGRFVGVVREEAQRLSRQLDDAMKRGDEPLRSPWPREDILAGDLVFALERNFESALKLTSRVEGQEAALWLHLDSHAIVQALTHLVGCTAKAMAITELDIVIVDKGRFARLDFGWSGGGLEPGRLHGWEEQVFSVGPDGRPVTLGEVLAQHGAQTWSRDDGAARHWLCVQLPTTRPEQLAPAPSVRSRPVYYDFDLFGQSGQSSALDETPLDQLSYTVFDTETTGLAPSEGDEIIAIGAVRIVNARLLEHECFDRLVRPRREVQPESQKIHGIAPQMLADQPPLEQVLPGFARFAEDTVLIAHNAAFDMRFLEMAHQRTGLVFGQPVLDTLLLSSLIQPGHRATEHRLEHIAARLGVAVVGRHTALGDAIVTGEVFLKLLPMLAERGISTLGQAREASRQSVYATLAY